MVYVEVNMRGKMVLMLLILTCKGLLPTIQELLPEVDQHFCVRHLYYNFRKKFPGKNCINSYGRLQEPHIHKLGRPT